MSADEEMLRLFVAVPVPAEVRANLALLQEEFKTCLPPKTVRWSAPENVHLTLRFLGSVARRRVDDLVTNLHRELQGMDALQLKARRLGCFPDLRYPRVIWAWVSDAAGQLDALHQRVVAATHDFTSVPAEERFVGHITLGRAKEIRRPAGQLIAKFVEGAVTRHFGEWTADRVQLIRSTLSTGGSQYAVLKEFDLG